MGRKLDKFWKYAERLEDGGFKCKFCHDTFAGGIARLKSHLAGIKGRDIGICDKVKREVREEAFLEIKGSNKKAKNTVDLIVEDDGSDGSTKDLQQSTSSNLLKKNKGEVDHLLVKHFISNNIAFNVIETSPFQEFVRSVAAYGPDYEVPSYSILEAKALPDFVTEVDEYVKDAKKKWVTAGCTLMFDVRSDTHRRSILNIVAYSSGRVVFLKSSVIRNDDCVLMKETVSSVIEDIGSPHVVQFIVKPGYVSAVANLLVAEYPHIYQTRCAAYETEQLFKLACKHVQWFGEVIDNAKLIVKYMYEHTSMLSLLRQYTDNKELKHPCMTRCASNFKMLQSLLDVEKELRLLIASPEWGGLDCNKGEGAKKVTSIIQNSNVWSQGRKLLQVLETLVQILRLVEAEVSTSGYLYVAMQRAMERLKELCRIDNNEEYNELLGWVINWRENIIHPIHAAAAFLNPSYMFSENFKKDSSMNDGIEFMLKNLVSEGERDSFMEQIQRYHARVSSLSTVTAKTLLKTSHPHAWWDYCGDSLPILKKYAIRILSQPCSFSSFERSWITFEAAQTKRSRLTPHTLNNLVHVRMNMFMMEKFKTMETQELLPIDLEKLSELPEYIDPPEEDEEDWEDKVTNSTQENLNPDPSQAFSSTENTFFGGRMLRACVASILQSMFPAATDHSGIGNVAHQQVSNQFDCFMAVEHGSDAGSDAGKGFRDNEGSSSQTIGFRPPQTVPKSYTDSDIEPVFEHLDNYTDSDMD